MVISLKNVLKESLQELQEIPLMEFLIQFLKGFVHKNPYTTSWRNLCRKSCRNLRKIGRLLQRTTEDIKHKLLRLKESLKQYLEELKNPLQVYIEKFLVKINEKFQGIHFGVIFAGVVEIIFGKKNLREFQKKGLNKSKAMPGGIHNIGVALEETFKESTENLLDEFPNKCPGKTLNKWSNTGRKLIVMSKKFSAIKF